MVGILDVLLTIGAVGPMAGPPAPAGCKATNAETMSEDTDTVPAVAVYGPEATGMK